MFDEISPKYDFLNHLLSFGIDRSWRKKLVQILGEHDPKTILDVATGTGDLAIAISVLNPKKIVGIDISEKMLSIGKQKISQLGLESLITLQNADAEKIPFSDHSFEAITVAFGVRNFEDLRKGLSEMKRVLRPGGIIAILEFSHPQTFPMKQMYRIYSRYGIPLIGKLISNNDRAYRYLPDSVAAFPSGKDFLRILEELKLKNVHGVGLSMGIATIYVAEK